MENAKQSLTDEIDSYLAVLKLIDADIAALEERKSKARMEIENIVKREKLQQIKTDTGTISIVRKQKIHYDRPIEDVIKALTEKRLAKYLKRVPAKTELSPLFETEVKSGIFNIEGVMVTEQVGLSVRFNKE